MTLSRAATWVLTTVVPITMALLVIISPLPGEGAWAIPLYGTVVVTWAVTGAFLVSRRPDNRVGWVIWAAGIGMGLSLVGQQWTYLSLSTYDGALPGTAAATLMGHLFEPSLFLVMLVPLIFPDGRFMSRRWAAVGVLLLGASAATLLGSVLLPGPIEEMAGLDNPLAVTALAGLAQALIDLAGITALVCLLAGILAAVVRYQRGTQQERAQLKWFGSVLILAFSMFFLATTLPQPYGQWAWIVASGSLGLIPVAIAVAILRHHLYEIDRLISRTIGWALVTGLLVAIFVGGVIALQTMLTDVTQGETLAVAASTLVAFALFQPVRRRVQRVVDLRFDRARYDAERTTASLAARLRGDMDLVTIRSETLGTVVAAVRPTTVDLWLRRADR